MSNSADTHSMPGASWFDLAPAAGGESYRIFLSVPAEAPPAGGWPLLVLTDGNATFPFATASLAVQAPFPTVTNVGWGVIAAVGYPSDGPYNGLRRSWDLVPPPGKSYPPYAEGGPAVVTGGAGRFLDFIEHELLPHLATMAPIDRERTALFGHSFGGLFTLYGLFERPDLFAQWIAASPSIFWEEGQILKSESGRRTASGGVRSLHFSAGEYEGDSLAPFEQRLPDAAARLELRQKARTAIFAKEMAERLGDAADGLQVDFELHPGENHISVLAVAVQRAVAIAFAIER